MNHNQLFKRWSEFALASGALPSTGGWRPDSFAFKSGSDEATICNQMSVRGQGTTAADLPSLKQTKTEGTEKMQKMLQFHPKLMANRGLVNYWLVSPPRTSILQAGVFIKSQTVHGSIYFQEEIPLGLLAQFCLKEGQLEAGFKIPTAWSLRFMLIKPHHWALQSWVKTQWNVIFKWIKAEYKIVHYMLSRIWK